MGAGGAGPWRAEDALPWPAPATPLACSSAFTHRLGWASDFQCRGRARRGAGRGPRRRAAGLGAPCCPARAQAGRVVPLFPILKSSTGEVISNHPPRPPFADGETEAHGCTSGRTRIDDETFFFLSWSVSPTTHPGHPTGSSTHASYELPNPNTASTHRPFTFQPQGSLCWLLRGLPDSQRPNSCTALEVQDNCHLLKSLPGFPQLNLISSPCSQSWLSLCPPQAGSSWRTGDTFLFIWGKVH